MAFLVLMFGNRGSRVDKMEKKSEDSFNKFFRILKAKYAIDTTQRKSGERVNPKVITLPRIAACFPSMVCDFVARDYIRTLFIGSELGLEKLSRGVLNTSITALIPKAWPVGKMIIPFAVAVKTDEVLTQREKQKNTLETVFTYFSASYGSQITPESLRAVFCVKHKLGTATSYSKDWADAMTPAENYIRDKRASDPNLQAVLDNVKAL